jgi:DNA-binding MarR family transcriptional regulator
MSAEKSPKIKSPDDLIVYNIGRLYILLDNHFSRIYAKHDLNPAKFNLLMVIKHIGKESGVSQMELGQNLYVSAANVTKLIDGLEKKGLAERVPSRKDRRVKHIKITDPGSKLLDKVWVDHVASINSMLDPYSNNEKILLSELLKRFITHMQVKKNANT